MNTRTSGWVLIVLAILLGRGEMARAQLCDVTAPVNGTLVATSGNTQNVLAWSGFSDAGVGLSCANTYTLVFALTTPPSNCASGTPIYTGTLTTFTHTGLTNGLTYGYRVCAKDNLNQVSTGSIASAVPATGVTPPSAWSRRAGNTGDDRGAAIASDGTSVFATGHFSGTANFGGTDLTTGGFSAQNVYLAKYSAAGVHLWSKHFSGTGVDDGRALATDASGNVIVVGIRQSPIVNYGGGAEYGISSSDLFIAKYSGAGAYLWSKTLGGFSGDAATGVATDASDNVIVVGYFGESITGVSFGGSTFFSAGSNDIFIAKYSAAGAHLWSKRLGSTSLDGATSVAVTSIGDVVVAGYFQGSVDFGGGALVSAGGNDMFVAKYAAANGAHIWSKRFGSTGSDVINSVKVDAQDNVLFVGAFQGSVDFGGGALTSAGLNDIALVKLAAANGAHTWSKRFGSVSDDIGYGLTVDASNNATLIGYFSGIVDFGGGNLLGGGGPDVVVATYSPTGAHLASKRFGPAQTQIGTGIASIGSMFAVTGYFYSSVDLGSGVFTSLGGADIFIGTLTP